MSLFTHCITSHLGKFENKGGSIILPLFPCSYATPLKLHNIELDFISVEIYELFVFCLLLHGCKINL